MGSQPFWLVTPHHRSCPQCGHELWAVQPGIDFSFSDCWIWRVFIGQKKLKVTSISFKHNFVQQKLMFSYLIPLIFLWPLQFILGPPWGVWSLGLRITTVINPGKHVIQALLIVIFIVIEINHMTQPYCKVT